MNTKPPGADETARFEPFDQYVPDDGTPPSHRELMRALKYVIAQQEKMRVALDEDRAVRDHIASVAEAVQVKIQSVDDRLAKNTIKIDSLLRWRKRVASASETGGQHE